LLSAVSIALVALGTTLTAWGPHATHPLVWWRARRAIRRLRPLWAAVHAELPELVLAAPGEGAVFQLYRRVVEIRDGSLALRRYVPPELPTWVAEECVNAGIPFGESATTSLEVLTEAAALAAALVAHQHRQTFQAGPGAEPVLRELDPRLDVEVHWLIRVAGAFTGSPVVVAVRQRTLAALSDPVSRPRSPG
jgi:hypothetical protein